MKTEKDEQNPLKVNIIDSDADTTSGQLGISENVMSELMLHARKESITKDGLNMMKGIRETSKWCSHPNELAFVAFTLGRSYEKETDSLNDATHADIMQQIMKKIIASRKNGDSNS